VIENVEAGEIIQVFNVNGEVVKEFAIQSNIENLPSDTYFIKVNNQVKKLIISN
jgi:hypothetical protein